MEKESECRSRRSSRLGKLVVVVAGVESSCMMDVVDSYRGVKRGVSIERESALTKRGRLEREADERRWFAEDIERRERERTETMLEAVDEGLEFWCL